MNPSPQRSCLYECTVMHLRTAPKHHEFVNRIFLFAFDLDELPELARKIPLLSHNVPGLYSFRDGDHFQISPGTARENAEAFLREKGVTEKPDRILLLTNTRFLGYIFNPISIWFCERADGSPIAAIAEVGNTFGELKPFLIPFDQEAGSYRLRTPKHFYVSPYSSVDLDFDFRFERPGERLAVFINNFKGEEKTLSSSLTGKRAELSTAKLLAFTCRYPFITLKVISLIHWHALILWIKRVPVHLKEANVSLQKGVFRPHKSLTKDRASKKPRS